MGLFSPSWGDPTSEEFQRRARAIAAQTPAYQSAFGQAEQATFGALGASGQVGGEQARLSQMLQAQAEGRGPSLAQMQFAQALQQAQAATQAQLASARGLSPAQAQQLALQQQAAARQQAAGQSGQLRLQEQMAAQSALGNLLGQRRQQELLGGQLAAGMYGTAGQLGLGGAQLEQQAREATMQAARQEAEANKQLTGSIVGGLAGIGAAAAGAPRVPVAARGREQPIVPGKAKFKGDTRSNDTVPAMLSPGEIVLPRTVAQAPDAPEKAKDFVSALKKQKRPSPKAFGEALSRLAELEARMNAMEALADLEAEQEG